MSTLQHTLQPAFRSRLALIVLAVAAAAAVTLVLVLSSGGSTSGASSEASSASTPPTQAQIQRQLEAVSGARYHQQASVLGQR
jgi:hypothetical protein